MSIEINWDALTTGPEGRELAASIRTFIHNKFQEADLPGFIRSVEVHDFEFGDACPSIVIKDICDPLPDFYEDEDEDDEEESRPDSPLRPAENVAPAAPLPQEPTLSTSTQAIHGSAQGIRPPLTLQTRRSASKLLNLEPSKAPDAEDKLTQRPILHRQNLSLADQLASPLISRSSTPGIPGGTSSLSYFHLPLAGRIQGSAAQSPLAAVAGWQEHQAQLHAQRIGGYAPTTQQASRQSHERRLPSSPTQTGFSDPDPSTRPSTSHSHEHPVPHGLQPLTSLSPSVTPSRPDPDPRDMQLVLHMSYSGNVRLALTAEILLDYPMPSFVSIPVKLNITGLSFDGVALVALLHAARTKDGSAHSGEDEDGDGDRKAHFCFLGQEDAETLVGAESILDADNDAADADQLQARRKGENNEQRVHEQLGSLLREMRVETEIGKTRDGRQNLRNVGKVEKFILEQVRRIFEDEFVYPSFWTFLV